MSDGPLGISPDQGDLIILTFDRKNFRLDISGNCAETAVALSMLEQAKRFFETQERLATAQQLQANQQRTRDVIGKIKLL